MQCIREKLYKYLRSIGCPHDDAEDVSQETFLYVLKASPAETCWSYYRKIAYNKWMDMLRRRKTCSLEFEPTIEDEQQSDDLHDHLASCMAKLSPVSRQTLRERYWDNLSRAEAAAKNGITEDGWKNRLQRAKQQLKELMGA